MLGWAIGFFIAALVAAVFGFGGIATAFTGIAIILFWVFLALFVLSLLFNVFGGKHISTGAHSAGGSMFAGLALIAGIALIAYAWMDNDMSAERVGREIDQTAVQLAEGTSEALGEAGNRAENLMDETREEIADDANNGNAEPESSN